MDTGYVNVNSTGQDSAPVTVNSATGAFGSSQNQTNSVPSSAASTGNPATAAKPGNASGGLSVNPTVLSDANIRDNTIPSIVSRATTTLGTPGGPVTPSAPLAPKTGSAPAPADGSGNADTDFQSLYDTAYGKESSQPVDPVVQQEIDTINSMKDENDSATGAQIGAIANAYAARQAQQASDQAATTKNLQHALLVGGASKYAPISSSGVFTLKESADMASLQNISTQEASAVADAEKARDNEDYQLLSKKLDLVDKLRTDKQTLATKIATDMQTANAKTNATKQQADQDNQVATLVASGVTDIPTILSKLTAAGYDTATADSVGKTLQTIAENNGVDIKDLTGNVKDFETLKQSNALPSSVASLPEDQQMSAYLKLVSGKNATAAPGATKSTVITLASAKSLGLPLSTVGMTDTDLTNSFSSDTAPKWFIEKANTENGGKALDDNTIQSNWDTYKEAYFKQFETTKASSGSSSSSGGP